MGVRSRIEELDEQLTGLGMLVDPIRRLVFSDEPDLKLIPYLRSQFHSDKSVFTSGLYRYSRVGKIYFTREYDEACACIRNFADLLDTMMRPDLWGVAREQFPLRMEQARKAIRAIPGDDPDTILPGQSPFATYQRIRAHCASAAQRIELFDPYLDAAVFHRYLAEVDSAVPVIVVTNERLMVPGSNRRDIARRDRIVSVSELFAAERPDHYSLLTTSEQHDRHLRIDDAILHLGSSVKDAAHKAPFTIANLDPVQSNHAFLDGVLKTATEWYGPNVRTHRTC